MRRATKQTRRHGYLLPLLGVQQSLVLINKLERCGFGSAVFHRLADG